jgi:hypothetical protein
MKIRNRKRKCRIMKDGMKKRKDEIKIEINKERR